MNPNNKTVTISKPPSFINLLYFKELFEYKELIYFLAWRDIKVRYKQTAIGIAWVLLQPVLTIFIFSIIFGNFLKFPSNGVPYALFTLVGLLPWQLFSYSLTTSSVSLINDQNLVRKVYFPKIIIPISSVISGTIDFAITFGLLIIVLWYYKILPTERWFFIPLLFFMTIVSALGIGLWLSALSVQYRDVRYVLPFLNQIWMYATPVAYTIKVIPQKWLTLYSINPMVSVVQGFRWAILNIEIDLSTPFYISIFVIIILFISGLLYFQYLENYFADIL